MPIAQVSVWDLILTQSEPLPLAVMICLVVISVLSWTVILSKWKVFKAAAENNRQFLKEFRAAPDLVSVATGVRRHPLSPLVSLFEFGFEEVDRQVKRRGTLANKLALERSLQLGTSEAMAKLERSLNWLATAATVSPFIGLLGTVWGIIDAFASLGTSGGASLSAVGPGISEALVTTALGLFAAIPAAVAYNYFSHQLREMGARLDDFSLEFLNLAERAFEG